MASTMTERQLLVKRNAALVSERSSWMSSWKSLSDYHLGHRGRFLLSDRNKGHRKDFNLQNNSSKRARRVFVSGLMAGLTNPARPWFKLSTLDHELAEWGPVKTYLDQVERIMRTIMDLSNLYLQLASLYSELGVFGQCPLMVYADYNDVVYAEHYTTGSYCLASNEKRRVDTLYREFQMQADVMAKRFGIEQLSIATRDMVKRGNGQGWVNVIHAIEPNLNYVIDSPFKTDARFRSLYMERDDYNRNGDGFLESSGFNELPMMVPRWDAVDNDIYSSDCPGITAIGDTKELQFWEKEDSKALEKQVNPPMVADSRVHRDSVSLFPGDVTWADGGGGAAPAFRPAYEIRPDFVAVQSKISEIEQRISSAFFEDLFLMIASMDRRQITATEIAERKEEKLLMLGPVLQRLNTELLDPLIDRVFAIADRAGILPPPPPDLAGQELSIEYISILAVAQKAVATTGIERLWGFAGQLAQVDPTVLDKLDSQQTIDEYAQALGVPPKIVRNDDEVEQIAQARAAQAQLQATLEQTQIASETAKTMAETPARTDEGEDTNTLDVMQQSLGLA